MRGGDALSNPTGIPIPQLQLSASLPQLILDTKPSLLPRLIETQERDLTPSLLARCLFALMAERDTEKTSILFHSVASSPLASKSCADIPAFLAALDSPAFCVADPTQFSILLIALRLLIKDLLVFPISAFYGKWNYPQGQLDFLREALLSFPDAFTQKTPLFIPDATAATDDPWNNKDLLQTLVDIAADGHHVEPVLDILKIGAKQVPELVLLGLASIPSLHPALKDFCISLGISFISGIIGNAVFVIPRLWTISPSLMLALFVSFYNADKSRISRIFDIAIEIKAVHRILEITPTLATAPFLVDLSILASRREYCNLEKWVADRISTESGCHSILDYLLSRQSNMDPDSLNLFLRAFKAQEHVLSLEQNQMLAQLIKEVTVSFSPQVEAESNLFYDKLYKSEISVPAAINTLLAQKESNRELEREVYLCFLHNLFDEIKFFTRYPEKELMFTAVLFGSLIQHSVLPPKYLGLALKYVFEACSQPVQTRLFKFGVVSLELFKSRLGEWPHFNTMVSSIPHLVSYLNSPEGQSTIAALNAMSGGDNAAAGGGGASNDSASTIIFQCPFPKPVFENCPADVQEKVAFLLNNISADSMSSKLPTLLELVKPAHYPWFSHHLLRKRVCIEPNHHPIYLTMISGFQNVDDIFYSLFVEAVTFAADLINSEKTLSSSSERSLLKNLGVWLGAITLGRNRPIKHNHLSLKDLLVKGYHAGRLLVVIPFVCKVLEVVPRSEVFSPPNPWTMAIMKLLAELYHYADLKLNLKFEIEVLSKALSLDIKEITPSKLLKQDQIVQPGKPNVSALMQSGKPTMVPAGPVKEDGGDALNPSTLAYPFLASQLIFSMPIFASIPMLKRLVHVAVERAIRDIIAPVVERSASIAGIATTQLSVKDFGPSSPGSASYDMIRKASMLMVQCLAGSLASVSSREPLKVSMLSNLKLLVVQNNLQEALPEQAIFLTVTENLDLALSIIQKSAAEKAIGEIDESLSRYRPPAASESGYPFILPAPLHGRPPTAQHLRIYEDFSSLALPEDSSSDPADALERFGALMTELEKWLGADTPASRQECRGIIRQIPALLTFNKDELALVFAQKIVSLLYKVGIDYARQVLVILLERLCEASNRLGREIKEWLLYHDDDRKYNVPVVAILLQARILTIADVDIQLGRILEGNRRPLVINFAVDLITHCCGLTNPDVVPMATQSEFLSTLTIFRAPGMANPHPQVGDLLQKLQAQQNAGPVLEQCVRVFKDWISLIGHPSCTVATQVEYVAAMKSSPLFEVNNIQFIRNCVEICVLNHSFAAVDALALLMTLFLNPPTIDGVGPFAHPTKLPAGSFFVNKELTQFCEFLSVVVLILISNHEDPQPRGGFNPIIFFRFFSTLLAHLSAFSEDSVSHLSLLTAVANSFHTVDPKAVPGFTTCWFSLISHRFFMPYLLQADKKYWPFYQRLLVDALQFASTNAIMYRGILRILLVLLHDHPEFLTAYYFSFVDVLPTHCVQLKNLILSAFPSTVRLPDPFTPNMKLDDLPDSNQIPLILSEISCESIQSDLDNILRRKSLVGADVNATVDRILNACNVNPSMYNAMILYLGIQATAQPVCATQVVEMLRLFVQRSDSRVVYLLLSSLANNLRYPNAHTIFFSNVVLDLFSLNPDVVTRVLLERLVVNRPHPYGLLVTFIELLRNGKYAFWEKTDFIRGVPELEKLFASVAKSINTQIQNVLVNK